MSALCIVLLRKFQPVSLREMLLMQTCRLTPGVVNMNGLPKKAL